MISPIRHGSVYAVIEGLRTGVAIILLQLVACADDAGSGSDSADDSTGDSSGTSTGADTENDPDVPLGTCRARVDGTADVIEDYAQGYLRSDGSIGFDCSAGLESEQRRWSAGIYPDAGGAIRIGTYDCTMLRGTEMNYTNSSTTWHSVRPGSECTIHIVEISEDAARGAFWGTLAHFTGDPAEPLELTEGVFHLPLVPN